MSKSVKMQGLEALNKEDMVGMYHNNLIFWMEADKKGQHRLAEWFDDRVHDIEIVYMDKFGEHPDDYVSES